MSHIHVVKAGLRSFAAPGLPRPWLAEATKRAAPATAVAATLRRVAWGYAKRTSYRTWQGPLTAKRTRDVETWDLRPRVEFLDKLLLLLLCALSGVNRQRLK